MIEAFALTWIGVIAAQIAPGPNLVAVAATALGEGRSPALFVVAGIASGMLIWSAATALGLTALIIANPISLLALKLVGGSYLIWLGIKAIRATITGQSVAIKASNRHLTPTRAWARGLTVVLTNPKAGLMWAAVATYLFGAGLTAPQVFAFAPLGALSGLLVYVTYAVLFSTQTATRSYKRATRPINAIFATAFGVMGGKLLWDGLKDLRP